MSRLVRERIAAGLIVSLIALMIVGIFTLDLSVSGYIALVVSTGLGAFVLAVAFLGDSLTVPARTVIASVPIVLIALTLHFGGVIAAFAAPTPSPAMSDHLQKVAQEYYSDKVVIGSDCRSDKEQRGLSLPAEIRIVRFENMCRITVDTRKHHVTAGSFVDNRFKITQTNDRERVTIEIPPNYAFAVFLTDMAAPKLEPLPQRDTSLYEYKAAAYASSV